MLMLASMITVNAQSLTGKTWTTDLSEDNEKSIVNFNFNDDGTMKMVLDAESTEDAGGMKMVIILKADVPGTYTLDGDKLSLKFDNKKADVKCDVDLVGLDATTKSMYKGMILGEINKQKAALLDEVLGSLPFSKDPIIVKSVTDKELVFEIDGTELKFTAAE